MKEADFPFKWDVPFEILYSHIEENVEHRTKQGHTIIIGPKGKHHSKGHIYLRLFDSVAEHDVETIARDLLTDTLLVNFLVIDRRSLESGGIRLSSPKLMNANQVQTVPRTVSKGVPAGFAVVAPLDASKVKDAFTLCERRSIHSKRDDMDRCVGLLKEGFGISDPADKLLSYWRSFNILYGSFVNWQSQPTKTSINILLNKHPGKEVR